MKNIALSLFVGATMYLSVLVLSTPYALGCDLESCQIGCGETLNSDLGDCGLAATGDGYSNCILNARSTYRNCNRRCIINHGN